MNEKTWIHGKDAALEDSIATLQSRLEKLGFKLVESAWLNPVPHVWSVELHDADCTLCTASGHGASREAALASALGEYLERLACNDFFADYYMGPQRSDQDFLHYPQERWFSTSDTWPEGLIDDATLQALYNPEGTLKPAHFAEPHIGGSVDGDTKHAVCALPYQRLSDGLTQWFPVKLLDNLYLSNGMSAGNSQAEARIQVLSELLERHVKRQVIAESLTLPDLPDDVLKRTPNIVESIEALRSHGYRVWVRDASLGGKYPVMSVTLIDPRTSSCRASFGAHPRFEVALERALTELLQGCDLEQLGLLSRPSFDQEEVASHENLATHCIDSSGLMPWRFFSDHADYDFHDWDFSDETSAEYQWLCGVFEEDGQSVYIADYEHLGIYACRALAPGLSEIYPPEDLEWSIKETAPLLAVLLNLHASDHKQLQALDAHLDEQDTDLQLSVTELSGIAADPGSPWQALRVGHLRLWLALALQQHHNVHKLCQWAIEFGEANGADIRLYRCIAMLAEFHDNDVEIEPFKAAISALYPAELMRLARSLHDGHVKFPGLHDPTMELNDMKQHQTLIRAFEKLQSAMRTQTDSNGTPATTPH